MSGSETFLGLTKQKFAGLVCLLVCISIGALGAAIVLSTRSTSDSVTRNRRTLDYLCLTTKVLDQLTVAAANQITQNFVNGTYYKLERQGILTVANVKAARVALTKYEDAHLTLKANGACR